MTSFFIIRLGADSENEIKKIDNVVSYEQTSFSIYVNCKQIPKGVSEGDIAIIWLGTNNNKGGKTPWIQGIRAIGKISHIQGEGGYNETKSIQIYIGVILPRSITKMDIVTLEGNRYAEIAAMPVIGVNNYSSQVVQRIEISKPGQNLRALLIALNGIVPGLTDRVKSHYPDLFELIIKDKVEQKSNATNKTSVDDMVPLREPNSLSDTIKDIYKDIAFDPDEDRDLEIDSPFDPSQIDIVVRQMTISLLEDRLDNNELDLTPDFQRQANLWDIRRKSRLIESILLRIPLPSFYFSEDSDSIYSVVDGLQRLCTIFHFKNVQLLNSVTNSNLEPLQLKGLQYLSELEGKSYEQLERRFQRRISELEITANIIRANTPFAVKFNVFARLNQGGLPLTAQEMRNAIFPGEWRNYIRELSESDAFIKATENKIPKIRQQDMELVLRFISLWQLPLPNQRPANQNLDEFLNTTVEYILPKWDSDKWHSASNAFFRSLDATCAIRGKHAFRKSSCDQPRGPINRGLFEAEMIVFGSLDETDLKVAKQKKSIIDNLFHKALKENQDFVRSLSIGTGSSESANIRVRTLRGILKEALYA
ncbi:DUF262 domain-containing protein [Enterobacter hormaechei]|uniref:DUF262 domain-containing protein n=1 Tax=Enterobacter hormaechei TaxID=158836 RepID=UPI00079750E7|nr:DUF262 domain-containing protein [Enterobacter hormaechei]CZW93954.1 Protein of uncharacterised function DUF262 [Enterobacter hormaechei]